MANTLILNLLPNGLADDGRLRMSIVAGFQLDGIVSRFERSPIAQWPRLADGLPLVGVVAGTDEPIPLVREPIPTADQVLWDAIFGRDAVVGAPPATAGEAAAYQSIRPPIAHAETHAALSELYAEAMTTSPTERLTLDHPVARAITALAELTGDAPTNGRRRAPIPTSAKQLLDPDRLTRTRLGDAVEELTLAGRDDAARVAVLAPVVLRQRARAGAAAPTGPGPLAPVTPIQKADVQQVIGLLLDHPVLARRLGLILDVTAPAASASAVHGGLIRLDLAPDAAIRRVFDQVRLPASRVRVLRDRRLFVMATRPAKGSEVVDGMLDIDPASGKYTVTDLDLQGLAGQLGALSRQLAAGGGPVALPIRRDAGLTLAQSGRADVADAARRTVDLWSEPPEEFDGDPVLYADDVTGGYRIDVSRNGGPFRSLMRRRVEYRIGQLDVRQPTLTAADEGVVEGLVAVQQDDGAGGHTLDLSEALVGWDGFSLAARLPGPVVDPAAPDDGPAETGTDVVPGYPVDVLIRPARGSVTPLRYGDTYSVRGRAVDLGGNSLAEDDDDGGHVTEPVVFLRHEPVPAPALVPVRPFGGGETLTRLVVRTDGDGEPVGGPAERHLAPPPSSQRMAERHGMFDAAIGAGRSPADRARLLTVATLQGSFNDPTVTLPDGSTVPADGIGVAGPPDADLADLPAAALPAGQYTFHDTTRLRVPYLPDPLAAGATVVATVSAGPGVASVGFGPQRWPEASPARLTVSAATAFSLSGGPAGSQRISVGLAPGQQLDATVSSPLRSELLGHLDQVPPDRVKAAVTGLVPLLSLRQPITLLHATRKPVADPTLKLQSVTARQRGDTAIELRARLAFHGPTTGKVDVVAEWTEVIDSGVGDVLTDRRRVTLASLTPDPGVNEITVQVRHDFGDTKHRAVQLFAVAATRFPDCFPELAAGDPLTLREGPRVELDVVSTRVPPPLQIHSVVPTYTWIRQQSPGRHEAVRHVRGVRVYVERPGATTGDSEEIGVVVYNGLATAQGPLAEEGREFVSHWGDDPVGADDMLPSGIPPLDVHFPGGVTTEEPLVEDLGEGAKITKIVGYPLRFAPDRGLWYADVQVHWPKTSAVFTRLALVRRQRHSVGNARVSRVRTTSWFTMPPSVGVMLQATTPGVMQARVDVNGPLPKVTIEVAPRLTQSTTDLVTPNGAASRGLAQVSPVNPGFASPFLQTQFEGRPKKTMAGTIDVRTDVFPLLQQRWGGRIVVMVERSGSDLIEERERTQPMFVEVLDFTELHGPVPETPDISQ